MIFLTFQARKFHFLTQRVRQANEAGDGGEACKGRGGAKGVSEKLEASHGSGEAGEKAGPAACLPSFLYLLNLLLLKGKYEKTKRSWPR